MSASPAASNNDQRNQPDQPSKITFRFCRECSNMLYPREDRLNNQLLFACRTCTHSEPAQSSCVYRNELSNTVGETSGITEHVAQDPTVGLPDFCTLCGNQILCEICGGETENGFYLEADDQDIQMGSGGESVGGEGGKEEEKKEEQQTRK